MTYSQTYYEKNKNRIKTYMAERRKDPELCKTQQLRVMKHRARDKGIEFSIGVKDLVWPEKCPILGVELSYSGDRWNSPSVDRIDPTKGYTKENCRVISYKANTMKSSATRAEIEKFCKNIIEYLDS